VAGSGFVSTAAGDGLLWATPRRAGVVERSGAQMLPRERLYLYAAVLARAPERCLEIGVAQGGSTRLIHAALSDLGRGKLVAVDPEPALDAVTAEELADRVTFLRGPSPEVLTRALIAAGGDFDFVLVDGDHSTDGVRRDLEGVARVTTPGALVLCHDAYFGPTAAGIDAALAAGAPFADGGIVSTTRHPGLLGGRAVAFAGLRLLVRLARRTPPPPERLPVRIARKLRRVFLGERRVP
jgi:predicted O-methyltransferase YrrM